MGGQGGQMGVLLDGEAKHRVGTDAGADRGGVAVGLTYMQAVAAQGAGHLDPVVQDQLSAQRIKAGAQGAGEVGKTGIIQRLVTQLHPCCPAARGAFGLLGKGQGGVCVGDKAKGRDHAGVIRAISSSWSPVMVWSASRKAT